MSGFSWNLLVIIQIYFVAYSRDDHAYLIQLSCWIIYQLEFAAKKNYNERLGIPQQTHRFTNSKMSTICSIKYPKEEKVD
ncbi:hypothetical protein MKW98_018386 [Papaver atlanticum]|uniref:Uncharacterized protein n=1 Tax=Papaver atlanticum TaxID=357466 RepID=A0AAD4XR27_9MAGN|nr:hypothetical protein MKW98_018386 [Papaver atlanticum]